MATVQPTFLKSDDIFECEDQDTLLDWHDDLMDLFEDIQSQLIVRALLPTTDTSWIHRAADKAASALTNLRRIERQLVACDYPLPKMNTRSDMFRAELSHN